MAERYVCTGCMDTTGTEGDANWCNYCQSYKYFNWVEEDEDTYYD